MSYSILVSGCECGPAERRLINDLMSFYQKLERPVVSRYLDISTLSTQSKLFTLHTYTIYISTLSLSTGQRVRRHPAQVRADAAADHECGEAQGTITQSEWTIVIKDQRYFTMLAPLSTLPLSHCNAPCGILLRNRKCVNLTSSATLCCSSTEASAGLFRVTGN